jgi:hypothetical protein
MRKTRSCGTHPSPCSINIKSSRLVPALGQVTYYEGRGDVARATKVARWLRDLSVSYRVVQLLALARPTGSVMGILRSEAFGLNVTKIPVPRSYPGWRYVRVCDW